MKQNTHSSRTGRMRHTLNHVVAGVVAAVSFGCTRTPEEDMKSAVQQAAEACAQKPAPADRHGRKKISKLGLLISASVPCDQTKDKEAMALAATEAGAKCEGLLPGETRIYLEKNVVASCTRAKSPDVPFATAFAPEAAASSPAKKTQGARGRLDAERKASESQTTLPR